MPRDPRPQDARGAGERLGALLLATLAPLTGCSLIPGERAAEPAAVSAGDARRPVASADAQLVADYLATLDTLAQAQPAQQAEIAETARRAATVNPTTATRLKWAFILAAPGHGRSDPAAARTLLGELLASPERLLPGERALAGVALRDVNARLAAVSDAAQQRQAIGNAQAERDRAVVQARRLQADNERLRKELEEAKAKLAAIAEMERALSGRPKP